MRVWIVLDMFHNVKAVFDNMEAALAYTKSHNSGPVPGGYYIESRKVLHDAG